MKQFFSAFLILVALLAVPVTVFAQTSTPAQVPHVPLTNCTENQAGSAQQENLLFCQTAAGVSFDGQFVYDAAISAANRRVIVGTPLNFPAYDSVDWGGHAIKYIEFSSGFHMEYNVGSTDVHVYNTLNRQV